MPRSTHSVGAVKTESDGPYDAHSVQSNSEFYFVYPGDLDTRTGGYTYDKRLIEELGLLGLRINPVSLPQCSLDMNQSARRRVQEKLAAIPEGSVVVMDGLALGVLDRETTEVRHRLRLVALCHHPLALESGLNSAEQSRLFESERLALANVHATLVTSDSTRRILIDDFGVGEDSITVAVPGTDRRPFAACTGNPPRLLTVGSLTRRKAHDVLISALADLAALDWEARFVGGDHFDATWAQRLHVQVAAENLGHRIQFAGLVPDIEPEYQQADVFILPSRFEGYGMVFAEALSAGLPVIAAKAGAVPDVVPGTAGLLVAPDDPEALAEAIHKLLTIAGLRQQLQQGARACAAELPTWRDSAGKVCRRLREVSQA